jgi:putative ABC transport system permease protein
MIPLLKLALRNVFRQKLRTGMTLAAISFGVVGLILSGGFIRDIYLQLGEALIHSQSGHLQISRTGYFTYGSRSPEKYQMTDAEPLTARVKQAPGVDTVMARVSFSGLLNNGKTDWPIIGEGVEPDAEARLGTFMQIVAGRQLNDKDVFGLTLGDGVAKALKVRPGERVTLLLNTAEGALNTLEFDVVGVFQSFSKDFDARAVRIPLAAARELLGSTGVNTLVVSLKQTQDTDRVAETLRATLQPKEHELRTWVQLNDFYEKTIALYQQQFGFLQAIILVMVLLSVANSVNMTVFERLGEFGTMMALGNRRGHVFRLILLENALLGAIGSVLGVAVGVGLAHLISTVGIPMPPPPNANIGYTAYIQIVPAEIARAFGVGLAATVLAACIPAYRVTRTDVVEALRQNC